MWVQAEGGAVSEDLVKALAQDRHHPHLQVAGCAPLLAGDEIELPGVERGVAVQFIANHLHEVARGSQRQLHALLQHGIRSKHQHLARIAWQHWSRQRPVMNLLRRFLERQPLRHTAA